LQIQYNKKKQEMREDPVLEGIYKAREFAVSHANQLVIALAVVVTIVMATVGYSYVRNQSLEKAQDAFGRAMIAYSAGEQDKAIQALSLVVDNHRQTPHAGYSAYLLGNLYLERSRYDEAIKWFEVAAENDNAGFVAGESTEGLAIAYEAKGEPERALEYYRKVLDDKRVSYRGPAVHWKMALINKQMGRTQEAQQHCESLVSDTVSIAADYRQKAESLLAEIEAM
jgi:tetratricopeptide (TPR) repeat protein